jgi:DNA-binding transcriptional LysR family regulator
VEQAVTGRAADFGFVRLPTEDLGFEVMPLFTSGTLSAVPKDHVLASRDAITAEDLNQADMVLLGRLRHNRQEIESLLRDAKSEVRCRVETHSVESSIALVAEGIGISIVPAFIGSFIASERVKLVPLLPETLVDYGIITLQRLASVAADPAGPAGESLVSSRCMKLPSKRRPRPEVRTR